MADNYLEYHALDIERLKEKRKRQLQHRRNRYLREYQKRIKLQANSSAHQEPEPPK